MMSRIKLKYITRDPDRHGNERYYFRRPPAPKIRLPGLPGSAEFMQAYQKALDGALKEEPKPAKPRPTAVGTLRWACAQYFQSAAFKTYSPRTQYVRRLILDGVCQNAGDAKLAEITTSVIMDGMGRRAHTPEQANSFLKAMRGLFKYAVKAELLGSNPASKVDRINTGSTGWHTWTIEEVQQFEGRFPVGTKARLALALLLFTGVRRSDLVLLGRQHVRNGWLVFSVEKNKLRRPRTQEIPILPVLQDVIDQSPTGDLAFLTSATGRPWANGDSFGNWFRDRCKEAGLPHCSPHGLRKAGATIAAENRATERELDAIYGWTDPKMAQHYTRAANKRRLAESAIHLLVPGQPENRTVSPSGPVEESETEKAQNRRKINDV